MKTKILIFLLALCLVYLIDIKAQPYIYYSIQLPDTGYEHYSKVVRYNLTTGLVEDFLPQQNIGEYVWETWDPSQSYLAINVFNWTHTIYNCSDTTKYFEFEEFFNVSIDEMLYSQERSKLYIFSNDYEKVSVLDVSSAKIISETEVTGYPDYNDLMYPRRDCFFSSDSSKIYLTSKDSLTNFEQVWTYSLETNQITDKENLSELGGYPGSAGYSLTFGRNGKGIIESYPVYYNNPNRDYYFKFYDFDADTSSPFIYHNGESEAYFSGNGEYTLILETYLDTLNDLEYYHTGEVEIYNTQNAQLLKTITLPPGGKVYTFDNYLNNIYYVIDIEKPSRQIYALKMDSIFNVLDLTSLIPSSTIVNSSPFTLMVNGNGFDTLSTVYFNDTAKTTTFISDSMLKVEISTSDISTVGNYPVWVRDEWGISDTLIFEVNPQPPVLSSISPAIALRFFSFGTPPSAITATATGEYFTDSSVVYFNGSAKTTNYISETELTFQLSGSEVSTIGNYPVWVSNNGATSDTLYFSVTDTLPQAIVPILECVQENGDNTFTAFWGYNNSNEEVVYIPIGIKNGFTPGIQDRGQPKLFLPGNNTNVFNVVFNGKDLSWRLDQTSVTANKNSTPCP